MLVLHERGEVSGLGPLTKTGTRRTGLRVAVANEMVSQQQVLTNERARVARAIERKLGKPYPNNTVLILAFDDTMAFDRTDNIANLQAVLSEYESRLQSFHSVALVGLQQRTFMCRRMRNAI